MPKIAIIQEGPKYFDLKASINRACEIMHQAKSKNADTIVFGECWLSGYPAWLDYCRNVGLWDDPKTKQTWQLMYKNSPQIDGAEIEQIKKVSSELGLIVIMGLNEKIASGAGNGTLYNTAVIIDKGELKSHHRKLMPTYTERLVHGLGDGAGLKAVDTNQGRYGVLICWEHFMPLTRQAMSNEGEDIHFALWPMVKEMHVVASRQYAFEANCYVVSVGQLMHAKDTPKPLELPPDLSNKPSDFVLNGGSCVIAPDGSFHLPPDRHHSEMILVDIPDYSKNIQSKMALSTSGHYSRPDVFQFEVNKRRIF